MFLTTAQLKPLKFDDIFCDPYLCFGTLLRILNIDFVIFLLRSFLFKLVRDKVGLNVEFISIPGRISTVSLVYSSALLTF